MSSLGTQMLVKFVAVGDAGVGKTALLQRFVEGSFKDDTTQTVGVEFGSRVVELGDTKVHLQIWDTAGQERFRSVSKQYFRAAAGCLLVYDITSRDSFTNVTKWLSDVRTLGGDSVAVMLLGNKKDLVDDREVTFTEASRLAVENDMMFLETSALDGENVTEAFMKTARTILTRVESGDIDPTDKDSGVAIEEAHGSSNTRGQKLGALLPSLKKTLGGSGARTSAVVLDDDAVDDGVGNPIGQPRNDRGCACG